jgi:hypothetical protein
MATVVERVGVLETKVENINEKIDDLKVDVKDMHDCLDRTRDLLDTKLDDMLVEYRVNRDKFSQQAELIHRENKAEHATLAGKIEELERQKKKLTMYAMIALAFAAGAGWFDKLNLPAITKFFGI